MVNKNKNIAEDMYRWATDIFPICRSLSGSGVRDTLNYIKKLLPDLVIHEVVSGSKAFDWVVPDEWEITDAYISDEAGTVLVDFKQNNLHVVGYSEPVDIWMEKEELDKHLHSIPEQPEAIPYVTTYYKRDWGFCLTHKQRKALTSGKYHVVIKSNLKSGVLNYGELILKGKEDKEVLLSTYICHPSMANNEVSGPVVTTALVQLLQSLEERRYTYRIVFVPETIGSIIYLSKHSKEMREKTIAGFVVTCVGDDNNYSFLPSRKGDSLSDRIAQHVLNVEKIKYTHYSFLDRGSDERQYCSPLIDLPICSIMRSKYGTYPEYHTSLDDLSFISSSGLMGAYQVISSCLKALESNYYYKVTLPCEPQLGKRGLYPMLSTRNSGNEVSTMMDFLAYADGNIDLIDIANTIGSSYSICAEIASNLEKHGLLEKHTRQLNYIFRK